VKTTAALFCLVLPLCGCNAIQRSLDGLPRGSAAKLHVEQASNLGTVTLAIDGFSADDDQVTISRGTFLSVNPWSGKSSVIVEDYRRVRKRNTVPAAPSAPGVP